MHIVYQPAIAAVRIKAAGQFWHTLLKRDGVVMGKPPGIAGQEFTPPGLVQPDPFGLIARFTQVVMACPKGTFSFSARCLIS